MRAIFLAIFACLPSVESRADLPPVYLNHFFAVLDAETMQAIDESAFLKNELGHYKTKSNANGTHTWTGHYLIGRSTAIELFGPNGSPSPLAKLGIALGVDHAGELALVDAVLQKQLPASALSAVRKLLKNAEQRPWFWLTELSVAADESANLWLMEYERGFIDGTTEVSREAHNKREYEQQKLFRDVVELSLGLPVENLRAFATALAAVGYVEQRTPGLVTFKGPNATLKLFPAATPHIAEIKLALNSIKRGLLVYRFGSHSMLKFSPDKPVATWKLRD